MVDYNNPPPICHLCEKFYVPYKNGVDVFLLEESGRIYKYWRADIYKCPECGIEIITCFGEVQDYFANREKIDAIYNSAKIKGTAVEIL